MSRRLERAHAVSKGSIIAPDVVVQTLRDHNLLLKIIWSGFGVKNASTHLHDSQPPCSGVWDTGDWDYLINQLLDPEHVRPHYCDSSTGAAWAYSKMGDNLDRSSYFDVSLTPAQWVSRRIEGARGRSKPGIKTIKAGHYSLVPPHGRMRFARGIDPATGITACQGALGYDEATQSFPGFQVAWLFSADPALGGVVKHCSDQDMFGRRLPWIGGQDAAVHSLRASNHLDVSRRIRETMRDNPARALMSFDGLRQIQRQTAADPDTSPHSDVRFKASRQSPIGILAPDSKEKMSDDNYVLMMMNMVHKQRFLYTKLGVFYPIMQMSADKSTVEPVAVEEQWACMAEASVIYPALWHNMPKCAIQPINRAAFNQLIDVFQHYISHLGGGDAQFHAVRFILQQYGYTLEPLYREDSRLLERVVVDDNPDAAYALLQVGASIQSPVALRYLAERLSQFSIVLDDLVRQDVFNRLYHDYFVPKIIKGEINVGELDATVREDISRCVFPKEDRYLFTAQQLGNKELFYYEAFRLHKQYKDRISGLAMSRVDEKSYLSAEQELSLVRVSFVYAVLLNNADWLKEIMAPPYVNDRDSRQKMLKQWFDESLVVLDTSRDRNIFIKNAFAMAEDPSMPLTQHDLSTLLFMPQLIGDCTRAQRVELVSSLFPTGVNAISDEQRAHLLVEFADVLSDNQKIELWSAGLSSSDRDVDNLYNIQMRLIASAYFSALNSAQQQYLLKSLVESPNVGARKSIVKFQEFVTTLRDAHALLGECMRLVPDLTTKELSVLALHAERNHWQWHIARLQVDIDALKKLPLITFRSSKQAMLNKLQSVLDALKVLRVLSLPDGRLVIEHADQKAHLLAVLKSTVEVTDNSDLRAILNDINHRIVKKYVSTNPVVELGQEIKMDGLADIPQVAFDVENANTEEIDFWRRQSYEYFKDHIAEDKSCPQSVRVYTAGDVNDSALYDGLDRQSGYAMSEALCAYTKQRAICSNASFLPRSTRPVDDGEEYKKTAEVIPSTVVTVAAPNLRKVSHYAGNEDLREYVQANNLNKAKYYQSMLKIWGLAFHALTQQAKANGDKPMVVITPLLGGGAYLHGQSPEVKKAAIEQNLKAMIQAYNQQPDKHLLPELHLCLPSLGAGYGVDTFTYVNSLAGHLPTMISGRLTVTQSDMFELATKTHYKSSTQARVAFVNPGSDRVPGGGCYLDQPCSVGSWSQDRLLARGRTAERVPGHLYLGARALEEQLAHVTNFMYAQCASMNPEHLRMDRIHKVDIDETGLVRPRDDVRALSNPSLPVVHHLANRHKDLYPEVSTLYRAVKHHVEGQRRAERQQTVLARALPHTSFSPPSASAMSGGIVPTASIPSDTHYEWLLTALTKHLDKSASKILGSKFDTLRDYLSCRTISAPRMPHMFAQLVSRALKSRGLKDNVETNTGRALVKLLNDIKDKPLSRYAPFVVVMREALPESKDRSFRYQDLHTFVRALQLGRAKSNLISAKTAGAGSILRGHR